MGVKTVCLIISLVILLNETVRFCTPEETERTNSQAFALVHYNNAESPRRAMAEYQGTIVKGVTLNDTERMLLRFRPNRDQKKNKYQERLNIGECYYWRTTGCQRNDECHYVHILANKGVDYQPWMLHSQRNKK